MSSEYPELTRRFFAERGIEADVRLSYGASEAKVPDIADCVVDITETGRALRAAGLRVIDTILTSYTEVVANPASHADPDKRHAMGQLMTLLHGVLEAREKVLLKLNVAAESLEAVLAVLPVGEVADDLRARPAAASPSRASSRSGTINLVIPALRDAGRDRPARDPDRQDRPLSHAGGTVTAFDEHVGLGEVRSEDGDVYLFHCVEIADGSRTIDVGAPVEFDLMRQARPARGVGASSGRR